LARVSPAALRALANILVAKAIIKPRADDRRRAVSSLPRPKYAYYEGRVRPRICRRPAGGNALPLVFMFLAPNESAFGLSLISQLIAHEVSVSLLGGVMPSRLCYSISASGIGSGSGGLTTALSFHLPVESRQRTRCHT
jgi:hypothetical protein